jgi:metal-sulfur cluster biosynthetic enzyme
MGSPQSIVDMGLIESITIEGSAVRVCLVRTDPYCVHFTVMRRYITEVLDPIDGVEEVDVTMSTAQLWTPDLMNPSSSPGAAKQRELPLVIANRG